MKTRLEQLDDLEDGSVRETLNLSQVEYLRKIEELNRSLVSYWDNDQRVKALKIAIQVWSVLGGEEMGGEGHGRGMGGEGRGMGWSGRGGVMGE